MRFLVLFSAGTLLAFGLPTVPTIAHGAPKQTEAQPASVRVRLLGQWATLTINGKPVKRKGGTLRYITSRLDPGKIYSYTFKAKIVRGAQTMTIVQKVRLKGGQQKALSFRWPASSSMGRRDSASAPERKTKLGRSYSYRFTSDHKGIDSIYSFSKMTAKEDSVDD